MDRIAMTISVRCEKNIYFNFNSICIIMCPPLPGIKGRQNRKLPHMDEDGRFRHTVEIIAVGTEPFDYVDILVNGEICSEGPTEKIACYDYSVENTNTDRRKNTRQKVIANRFGCRHPMDFETKKIVMGVFSKRTEWHAVHTITVEAVFYNRGKKVRSRKYAVIKKGDSLENLAYDCDRILIQYDGHSDSSDRCYGF